MNKLKMITILLICILFLSGCDIGYMNNPQPEPPPPKEYEVLSVVPYTKTRTNQWGAVVSQDPGYAFTYIDENGVLHSDTIYHTEHGIWKVCLGEENKYVEEKVRANLYRYLYLTEETLRNMSNLK